MTDAFATLLECGRLAPDQPENDRVDGLTPAGWVRQVVLGERRGHGCALPADPFALPED